MGTELTTRREDWGAPATNDAPIVPASVAEIDAFVGALIASGATPRSYESAPADKRRGMMVVAVMKGKELGMLPLQALQSIYVVNGIPTIYGDALPAFVMAGGNVAAYRDGIEGEGDKLFAWCEVERVGVRGVVRRTFSIADAAAQSLLGKKGPWQHSRGRMCLMRARAYAFRDMFADALRGVGIFEEQRDIEASRGFDALAETSTRRIDVLSDTPGAAENAERVTPAAGEESAGAGAVADGPQVTEESPPADHVQDAEFEEPAEGWENPGKTHDAEGQPILSDADEFPGDAIARERATLFDVFKFCVTDSKGEVRETTDGEKWCASLVAMLKKADVPTARAIWIRNAGHVAAAERAGHNALALTVREAAHMAGAEIE